MATIFTNVSGSNTDNVLSISNEQITRKLSIGSDWNRLRIGIRFSISTSYGGSSTVLNPVFAFGLCAGTSSVVYGSTTPHFLGYMTDITKTWTRTNSAGNQYRNENASASYYAQKTGSTIVPFAYSQIYVQNHTGSRANRFLQFIEFTKSGSGEDPGMWELTYQSCSYKNSSTSNDWSSDSFYGSIMVDTSSFSDFHAFEKKIYVPVSESVYGYLDTILIYWNKTDVNMEISDVAAYKFR